MTTEVHDRETERLPFYLRDNFAPIFDEYTDTELAVSGSIPPELNGRFFRNGPNPQTGRSAHWFLGNGMIHGVELRDGRANWYRNRYVRTPLFENPKADSVVGAEGIMEAQELVKHVVIAEHVQDYAIRLVLATHPQGEFAADVTNRFIRFGSSPRGVQALVLAGKVRAMLDERYHVSFADIESSALPALRHRILLNFEGQAEGITTDEVIADILQGTPKNLEQQLDVP